MKQFLLGIIFLLASNFLFSENKDIETDSIQQYHLNEINIVSPKYKGDIFSMPVATTMVPSRLIASSKIDNLADVNGFIPNLFMPDYGSKLTSPIYIRGVGNRINTPSVGLYVDGVPYFEKAAFNFDFYNIERIEVLRGPQGTLYGRNAMGGLINIITHSPGNRPETAINIDYGSFNQLKANIGHSTPIGEKMALGANLNYTHTDGFFTNVYTQTNADYLNSISGRVKLLYTPTNRLNFKFTTQYEQSKQNGYPYAIHNDSLMTVADVNYNQESSYNRKMLSSGLQVNYESKGFDIRSMTSLQKINDAQTIDQDFTPASIVLADQDQNITMLSQELNLISKSPSNYQWLFGVFGFYQNLDKEVRVTYGEDGIAMFRLPFNSYNYIKYYNHTNTGIAAFHQSELKMGKLKLTAGIRIDYEKALLDYVHDKYINEKQSNADQFDSELTFLEVLPRFSLTYSVDKHFTPYATIAKGYNSGGFNSTFEREEDRTFDPETTWNYEAGIKAKWLEKRIYSNLSLFYIDWSNQQIYQTVPSGAGSMLTNAGKSVSKGVEFEIKIIPIDPLETWFSFGYNDAKFVEYVKDATTDYSGNDIPYVPKYSFNAGINYTINLNKKWVDNIGIHTTYQGFGKHYWKETNVAFQKYYGLLNQRISLNKNQFTFSIFGKNVLNSDYNAFYFQALGKSYAQKGKPAQFGVALKYTF